MPLGSEPDLEIPAELSLQVITHVMPLEDVPGAMDLQDAGGCGKVRLLPHGELDGAVAARSDRRTRGVR